MRSSLRHASLALLALASLAPSQSGAQESTREARPAPESLEAKREAALEIARSYVAHRWRAGAANRLHGRDADGVHVDTPDVGYNANGWREDDWNVGVPYQWGGFSSLDEFDRGVEDGLFAGHIPTSRGAAASTRAVGVDCSGLVSRCWDLPYKQSTRSLGALSYELASFDELRLGDAINRYDAHVMLFVDWADEARSRVRVIEAVTPRVREAVHDVADLRAAGYRPLRYRPFDERWTREAVDFSRTTATFEPDAEGRFVPAPDSAWTAVDDFGAAFPSPTRSSWVRLVTTARGEGDEPETEVRTVGIQQVDDEEITLHVHRAERGGVLETLMPMARDESALSSWLTLAVTEAGQARREILSATRRPGTFEIAGEAWPAHAIELEVQLTFGSGENQIPVYVSMELVTSERVPVGGLVRADHHVEIDFGEPRGVVVVDGTARIAAFGQAPGETPDRS